jgi:hypothetical protein
MDLRRARIWEWLTAGFGALVAVAPFLGWYEVCADGSPAASACRTTALTGWEAFAVADVVMVLAGTVGVAVLVLTLTHRTPAVPIALTSLGALVAIVAAALALLALVAEPEGGASGLLAGAWLGAAAAVGLVVAMLAAMRDERVGHARGAREETSPEVRALRLSSSPGTASAADRPGSGGAA